MSLPFGPSATLGPRSAIRWRVLPSHLPTQQLTHLHPSRHPDQNNVTTEAATARQHPPRRSARPLTATAHRTFPGGLGEARTPGPRLGSPAPSLLYGEADEAAAGVRHRTGTELGDEPGGAGLRVPGGAAEGHACLEAVTVWARSTVLFLEGGPGGVGGAHTFVCMLHSGIGWTVVCMNLLRDIMRGTRDVFGLAKILIFLV